MSSKEITLSSITLIFKVFLSVGAPSVEYQKYVTFYRRRGGSGFGLFVQPSLIFCPK